MFFFRSIIQFIDWLGRFQVVQAIIAAKWPVGLAMLTTAMGIAEGQPYMWIVMAASLVFMGTVVGLVYVNAWRERNSPVNKLRYITTVFNCDLVPMNRQQNRANQKTTVQRKLDKTQIGVMLRNDAHFPISVILHKAETAVETLEPPRTKYPKPATMLLPGNVLQLCDGAIAMNGFPCEKLEGKMDFVVKYGFTGKETNTLEFKAKVEAMMQPVGFLTQINTSWESDQIRA